MTPHNDHLGDDLGRALHQQADGISGAPITLDAVKGTAGRIRRRRALAASAAVAAAVAIVVPTAMLGTDLFDGAAPDNAPPATMTASGTGTEDETPVTGSLDIRGLEQGATPGIPLMQGSTLISGSETSDLGIELTQVAQLGEWVVGTAMGGDGADSTLYVLHPTTDDIVYEEPVHHTNLVVSDQNDAVAWVDDLGRPKIWQAGATEPIVLRAAEVPGNNPQARALNGERCDQDPETTEGAGCTVWFTQEDGEGGLATYVASTHGVTEPFGDVGFRSLTGVSNNPGSQRYIGMTQVKEDSSSCSGISGPQSADITWETCDHYLLAFSPDGSRILATDPYGDGIGDTEVAILDAASGDLLVSLDNRRSEAFVNAMVWEDDEHVLATVSQAGQWALVRIGLDGSMEYAAGPQAGVDVDPPWFLARRP